MRLRRRAPPHLARRRAAVARRPDDPAHLRPLRAAAGQGVHDRRVQGRRERQRASASPSTCRPTGASRTRSKRSSGCTRSTSARAGRTRSSAPPTCSRPTRSRPCRRSRRPAPLMRGDTAAAALARARGRSASPAARPRARTRRSTRTSRGCPELGLRLRAAGLPEPARVGAAARRRHPDLTFVLIHAGMPIAGEPWRDALIELCTAPERVRQALRPGHVRAPRSTPS